MSRIIANRYEIEDEIGRGGMAVVYRANDLRLNRQVALKLLHPFLATQTESAARFLREAEAIAKLHHKNIVEIFDTGQDDETGSHFLVMELLEGVTLKDFIEQHQTVIPEVAIAMCCSLCDALEHAHRANIIHRDVKPENIMFSKDGLLKLTDFGIARILDAEKMTASGSLIGSPAHMSPEIIEGHKYSFSCDIFSLGTVLYFALTNTLPFTGSTPMAVFKAILDSSYPPPSRLNLSISRKIDRIVACCLKTDPAQRYQSMGEFKTALLDILKPLQMTDYIEIVQAYYADPDAFIQSRLPEIKECLNASAQLAVREHRLPNALETLNTVLSYDPEDPQANALLRKLRSGDQIRKRVIIGASILTVILLGCGIALWCLNAAQSPEYSPDTDETPITASISDTPSPLVQIITDPNPEVASILPPPQLEESKTDPADPADSESRTADTETQKKAADKEIAAPANADALAAVKQPGENAPNSREQSGTEPTQKARTPQKSQDGSAKAPSTGTEPQKPEQKEAEAPQPTEEPEIPKQPELITLTQPVFPPDGYAFISGKRYNANENGDISLSLPAGTYSMTVTCKSRCVPIKTTLVVTPELQNKAQEIVALEWADAHLTVNASNSNLYFVAIRLDEQGNFTNQIEFLIPGSPKGFNGFNPLGNKPIKLEVFAISKNKKLTGMTRSILEKEKTSSTRVELLPGDTRTVTL